MAIITDIDQAVSLLQAGELVALPTETVYGLGADATNEAAVAGIFKAKNRPSFDPLIVHVADVQGAQAVAEVGLDAMALFEQFSPGPLTLVLPKKALIPDLVTSGHPTVGVRIPAHPTMQAVLQRSGLYIAAPSANPFGFTSPTTAEHVETSLGDRIAAVLDGGPCEVGVESTIVDMSGKEPKVLRLGGISLEALEEVLGPIPVQLSSSAPHAPGMLLSHYNPGATVHLFPSAEMAFQAFAEQAGPRDGLLTYGPALSHLRDERVVNLSPSSDDAEAARNLFHALRAFGARSAQHIFAHELPEHGLGRAVNDRLKRAAAKQKSDDKL